MCIRDRAGAPCLRGGRPEPVQGTGEGVLGPVTDPQTVHQAKFCMGAVLGLIATQGRAGPVSYTHLDVYKRQHRSGDHAPIQAVRGEDHDAEHRGRQHGPQGGQRDGPGANQTPLGCALALSLIHI